MFTYVISRSGRWHLLAPSSGIRQLNFTLLTCTARFAPIISVTQVLKIRLARDATPDTRSSSIHGHAGSCAFINYQCNIHIHAQAGQSSGHASLDRLWLADMMACHVTPQAQCSRTFGKPRKPEKTSLSCKKGCT